VTTLAWTVTGGLAVVVVLLGAAWSGTRRRLRGAERRLTHLEERVAALDTTTRQAVDTARAATAFTRRHPGGPPPDPPRVVLEPLTGRLVKAVALGAGARRAVTRLTRGARSTPS
jgi:hypothetical protein